MLDNNPLILTQSTEKMRMLNGTQYFLILQRTRTRIYSIYFDGLHYTEKK